MPMPGIGYGDRYRLLSVFLAAKDKGDIDAADFCEFDGVADQIDEDLPDASTVADECCVISNCVMKG